jgi:uncharacterized protein
MIPAVTAVPTETAAATPADPAQRVELLDALRGFALFGVCLANLFVFAYWDTPAAAHLTRYALRTDEAATYLMHALVEGKFYSIFSLLFGLGFALQFQRAETRGGDALPLYRRRLRILMLIGLAHLLLLWYGDILLFYALMGLILMRMRHMEDRRALRWATLLVFLPVLFYMPVMINFMLSPALPFFAGAFGMSKLYGVDINKMPDTIFTWYTSGSIVDWFKLTTSGVFFRYADLVFTGRPFKVLAMFVVGMVVGRRAIWSALDIYAPLLRRVAWYGFLIGLPANLVLAAFTDMDVFYAGSLHGLAESMLYALAVAPLALAMAASFALLWRRDAWRRVLNVFSPAGKMALTNYLMQTVIATIVFSGVGFNLAGHIGPTWLWLQAIVTLSLQIAFSRWWLAHYRFGPLEWVWRSLTYRARQPMKIARPVTVLAGVQMLCALLLVSAPANAQLNSNLKLHEFRSTVFGNVRTLRVLLPPGYDDPANRARRYPVLYLNDGQNLFDSTTAILNPMEWRADETAGRLIASGRIPPIIIVGIDNAGRTGRFREYFPYVDRYLSPPEPNPQGARYPAFIIDEVIPFIDQRYRTMRTPDGRGLGGSSAGALAAMYTVVRRPGVFGRLLIESPSIYVDDARILREAASVRTWPARIFLGVGTNENNAATCDPRAAGDPELVADVRRFERVLRNGGVSSNRIKLLITPCGQHNEAAWAVRFPDALRFLYGVR